MVIDLGTTVAGIRLGSCVYNASGPRTGSAAALSKIASSEAGAVLTKSATLVAQQGNPQPRIWHSSNKAASMNSEGLPNSGIDYYVQDETIEEAMAPAKGKTKPYMVSISGKTLEDNLKMLDRIQERIGAGAPISCVELNLACPNVIGKVSSLSLFARPEGLVEMRGRSRELLTRL